MINIEKYFKHLQKENVEFITGVPCTLLNDFCLGLNDAWKTSHHIIAANEGNAIGSAAGYHVATNTIPLVYMQNSGLGNALNPLISLADSAVYSIPMVMLIGWRGESGISDWPQHQRQGELTPILIDDLGIKYRVLEDDQKMVSETTSWAIKTARDTKQTTALLVRKGVMAKKEKSGFNMIKQQYLLSREQVIESILKIVPKNTIFVASTGRITRELYAVREKLENLHNQDFLNIGAMGHSISIASGIASARPENTIVCLDGDAAALMHLGSFPITANHPIPNLIDVVLNNGAHESVGGQQTVGFKASLNEIARASGYDVAPTYISTIDEIEKIFDSLCETKRPKFIEIRIRKGMRDGMPILKINPQDRKEALIKWLAKKAK